MVQPHAWCNWGVFFDSVASGAAALARLVTTDITTAGTAPRLVASVPSGSSVNPALNLGHRQVAGGEFTGGAPHAKVRLDL